jgi:hypothetical protein
VNDTPCRCFPWPPFVLLAAFAGFIVGVVVS